MDDRTLTVSEFADAVRLGLEQLFPYGAWVEGEISNLSRARNGHVYFDLVEPGDQVGGPAVATVPVVLFRDARDRVNRLLKRHGDPIRMADGVRIRIQGMVEFYPPTGKLQLRMTAIDPTYTLGRLAAERDALLERLAADGALRRNAECPVPPIPVRIGLATSIGSAAHADIVRVFERSELAFTLVEADTAVQGAGAEVQIAAAVRALARAAVDVVIVSRGGGSRTDLATFDHEKVARAIAAATVPVFTGLGHDIDRSVADEVAHTALTTPTAAAQHVVGLVRDWLIRLDEMAAAVSAHGRRGLHSADARVDHLAHTCRRSSQAALDTAQARIRQSRARLSASGRAGARAAETRLAADVVALRRAATRALVRPEHDLDAVEARVRSLDPARLLARGWSVTRRADGEVVRSTADVEVGAEISSQVADGTLTSTIRGSTDEGRSP